MGRGRAQRPAKTALPCVAGRAVGDLRRHNRAIILELIRTMSPVSRTGLMRAARLSMATVIGIVDQLVREGYVRNVGEGPSTGGRRPVLLELVPRARSAVGIEIGPRRLKAVVTDLNASVRARIDLPSKMARGPRATSEQIGGLLEQLGGKLRGDPGEVLGIGVAVPAPVSASTGMIFSPPSYPRWGVLNVGELVAQKSDLPVLVDNDANARAIGEHLFGAGRGVSNMLCVVVHRGVGSAAIMDGDLRRGADGVAGEIGHTVVDLGGPRCGCGKYGCLEAFVGREAIVRKARRALARAGGRKLAGQEPDRVRTKDVVAAALEGDELASGVLEETGEYLGIGLSNGINILNPELVVIGGSTMQAGDLILAPAVRTVRQRALPGAAKGVRIAMGQLGEDAGAVGAAALVLRELFAVSVPRRGRERAGRESMVH